MRKIIFYIIIISLIICFAVNICPLVSYISNSFWTIIGNQLDREEVERENSIKNDNIVRGKDTILIWKNTYEITKHYDGKYLSIKTKEVDDVIIKKIKKYKTENGKLYILSDEGYVVVDKNNKCFVFVSIPENEFVNGYTEDEYGNKTYNSRKIKCSEVKYLLSYDEFSYDDKKVFDELSIRTPSAE